MIYLATNDGLVVGERRDDWQVVRRSLDGKHVTAVIAREGVILAGTTAGIFRSEDEGQTWREASRGLTHRHIRWLAFHPDRSDYEFGGTEPAGIFTSQDGGESWLEAPEVVSLRDRLGWFLPYSPEAGCVRGFAFHGERAYAAVEVGGVLRSQDGGATWGLVPGSDGRPDLDGPREPFIHPDVHSIQVHPSSPDLVYAPTGGGFYRSHDGGVTWKRLYDAYCRAVWVDPADADHMILGPADQVDTNGRIEQTQDGGETWALLSSGLELPWRRHMVERFIPVGNELLAVLSNGQVLAASITELKWRQVLKDVSGVNAIAEAGEER